MTRYLPASLRMVPMTLVMGIIFFLSHKSGDDLHLPGLANLDKLAHLLIYSVLAAATLFAFNTRWKKWKVGQVVVSTIVFCLLYGIFDEFHQSFIPGRFPSVFDILADGLGAVLACLVWLRLRGKMRILPPLRS